MISGGLLRWVATRLEASTSQDVLGMRDDSWTSSGTFRCDLREQVGSEQFYADGVAVRKACEVRARWPATQKASLSEVDRLSIRGRTFRIQGIQNLDQKDRVAVISCEEVI